MVERYLLAVVQRAENPCHTNWKQDKGTVLVKGQTLKENKDYISEQVLAVAFEERADVAGSAEEVGEAAVTFKIEKAWNALKNKAFHIYVSVAQGIEHGPPKAG